MTLWSKIFLGLIVLAVLPFFYLAAGVLKINQSYRTAVTALEKQVADAERESILLAEGDDQANLTPYRAEDGLLTADAQKMDAKGKRGRLGLRQFEVALQDLLGDRGRVWTPCTHTAFSAMTGEATVTPPDAIPHNITDKNLLYIFEAKPAEEKGTYLGEFKVTKVDEKTVTVAPAATLIASEVARIGAASGDWILYEKMPVDRFTVFAGKDEAELKGMLPDTSEQEYIRHGQAKAESDTDDDRIVDGKYERMLRDYAVIFRETRAQIGKLLEDVTIADADLKKLQDAHQAIKDDILAADEAIKKFMTELERSKAELAVIKKHRTELEASLAAVSAEIAQLLQKNKDLSAQWAQAQTDAARKIDQRTGVPTASR